MSGKKWPQLYDRNYKKVNYAASRIWPKNPDSLDFTRAEFERWTNVFVLDTCEKILGLQRVGVGLEQIETVLTRLAEEVRRDFAIEQIQGMTSMELLRSRVRKEAAPADWLESVQERIHELGIGAG